MKTAINFGKHYTIFFGIVLVIVIVSQFLLNFSLSDQENRNTRQLLIARQRMLMQDFSENLLKYDRKRLKNEDTHEEVAVVRTSLEKFQNAQLALVNGSELYRLDGNNSERVQALFTRNAPNFIALRDELKPFAEGKLVPDEARIQSILSRIEAYNAGITEVHTLLSQENQEELSKSVLRGWMVTAATLIVFILSFFFLIRPVHKSLHRHNLDLLSLNNSLDEAIKVKDEFMANVSHELRTPLNGVMGLTELLAKTSQDEEQRRLTRSIKSSADILLRKINDLLDFSKVTKGDLELEMNRFNLKDCLEEVLDLIKPAAHVKNLEVILETDNDLPSEIMQDEFRFRQVLRHLLDNALKFTEHGEILLRAEVVGSDSGLFQIRLTVKDTGIGFDKQVGEKLFQGTVLNYESGMRKYNGSGLGLALSREIVNRMGGRIWAESTPGKGSAFYFTIIAQQREIKTAEQEMAVLEMKALVIDDNKTNLKIIVRQLSNWGIQATPFNSPDIVADLLENLHRFDFCIMDMQMAEMDSRQLAMKIRMKYPQRNFPIILLSSTSESLLQDDASLFTAFLTKPVKYTRLFDTIANVMGMSTLEMSKLTSRVRGNFAEGGPNGLNVLIAQDNELTRAVTNLTLERLGYSCELAMNNEQVLEKVKSRNFDVVVMDVKTNLIDGVTATRQIQKSFSSKDAPLIIGVASNELDQRTGLAAGMDDCIDQSMLKDELDEKISSWFEIHD